MVVRAQTAANFVTVTPCRVVDTREEGREELGSPTLVAGAQRDFPILQSTCNIPSSAQAYALNITVVPHGSLPYLTVWPTGQTQPSVSTLNSRQGAVVANAAIVPAGTNGSISVYAAGVTDLIIDVSGYFAPQSTAAVEQVDQKVEQINQQITQTNQRIAQQGAQLNEQINQVNQQGSQLVQQVNQQTMQIGQIAQQISPLVQQINQVGQQASLVTQEAAQVGQQATQITQLMSQINQVLNDIHMDSVADGTALGAGTAVTGSQNTATGSHALSANSSGNENTANGSGALIANVTGNHNVGIGVGALSSTRSGDSNIALGYHAGSDVGDASNAIEIGHLGQPGDNGVIRLGTQGIHTSTYIAGIFGSRVGVGDFVLVDGDGRLGAYQSSIRYKEDVRDLGDVSDALMDLRPVQFRYKQENEHAEKPLQYGLIAEEVAKVYPELVVRNHQGEIEMVQYHQLPALLLNELQKQHRVITQQRQEMRELLARIAALEAKANPKD